MDLITAHLVFTTNVTSLQPLKCSLFHFGVIEKEVSHKLSFKCLVQLREEDISDVKMDRASGPPITRRILDSHTLGFVNNRNRQESDKKKKKML